MKIPNRKRLILMGILLVLTVLITALIRVDCGFVRHVGRTEVPAGTYATLGDICVFLNVIMLGSRWGALVSALGCVLADVFVGSYSYIIGTLIIKASMAFFLGKYAKHCDNWKKSIVVALIAEAIMVIGYFVFDLVIFVEYAIAIQEILVNLAQGLVCAVIGSFMIHYLQPIVRKAKAQRRKRTAKKTQMAEQR